MKIYDYKGMALFISGVAGKGQFRLKDLFNRLCKKNCLYLEEKTFLFMGS